MHPLHDIPRWESNRASFSEKSSDKKTRKWVLLKKIVCKKHRTTLYYYCFQKSIEGGFMRKDAKFIPLYERTAEKISQYILQNDLHLIAQLVEQTAVNR